MHDRRQNHGHRQEENQPGVQGENTGEENSCRCFWREYLPHAAQQHGDVEKTVQGTELAELAVAPDADRHRDGERGRRDQDVTCHPRDKAGAADRRVNESFVRRSERYGWAG